MMARMGLRTSLWVAAALAALACIPATASAMTPSQFYGGPKLTYYDASGYTAAVAEGVREWNVAGTRISLTPVDSAKKADIVVHKVKKLVAGGSEKAGLGLPGNVYLSAKVFKTATADALAEIVVHEFGHSMGLHHSKNKCDVMFPRTAEFSGCHQPAVPNYLCGPQAGDLDAMAAIWGGKRNLPGVRCTWKAPEVELVNDPAELTAPDDRLVKFSLINRSAGELDSIPGAGQSNPTVIAVTTDDNGNVIDGCITGDGPFVAWETDTDGPIPPGSTFVFSLDVCPVGGPNGHGDRVFHFRLAAKRFSKPYLFGPTWTVTVHFP